MMSMRGPRPAARLRSRPRGTTCPKRSSAGSKNAAVLPVPVCAAARRVAPGKHRRDGLGLNRRGRGVTQVAHRLEHRRGEAQVSKARARLFGRRLSRRVKRRRARRINIQGIRRGGDARTLFSCRHNVVFHSARTACGEARRQAPPDERLLGGIARDAKDVATKRAGAETAARKYSRPHVRPCTSRSAAHANPMFSQSGRLGRLATKRILHAAPCAPYVAATHLVPCAA